METLRKIVGEIELREELVTYPQATIFHAGDILSLGYHATECRYLRFEILYAHAGMLCAALEFRENRKGSRSKTSFYGKGSELVIVEGWNHPKFQNWSSIKKLSDSHHFVGRFNTFDKKWSIAYDKFLTALTQGGARILADYRMSPFVDTMLVRRNSSVGTKTLDHFKTTSADEITDARPELFEEGAVASIIVNKYERDPRARRACIEHFGPTCRICEFDFSEKYPGIGYGFIHVHHLVPLSSIRQNYQLDPLTELIPVCPNCHSMLHRRNPPYTPDEVRAILRQAAVVQSGDDDLF